MTERTLVGVPFYEKESQQGLDITLKNIDDRLNELAIDSSIVVQVNGPETAQGQGPDFVVNASSYNAHIEVIKSDRLGQTRALDDLIGLSAVRGIHHAFMTDADVYRFPGSLKAMWEQADKPIIGAHYRPYPIQIVEAEFGNLSYEERLLYQIFDGDQSPQVRRVLRRHGLDRDARIKGSLMLLDTQTAQGMHGDQHHAADSVMNRIIGSDGSRVAEDAFFMHMGRVDMADHIKARLRHFRGAAANNDLEAFLHKEIVLPDESVMNQIAEELRSDSSDGDFHAMLYLMRCAVRKRVNEICLDIASHTWDVTKLGEINPMSMSDVMTYQDAQQAASRFFLSVDWDDVIGTTSGPPPVTQELLRRPFNLDHHMFDRHLARAVFDSLGVESLSGN